MIPLAPGTMEVMAVKRDDSSNRSERKKRSNEERKASRRAGHPVGATGGRWHRLRRFRGRAGRVAGQVAGELTAEGALREPIDFSAPSVPYYADLASRFGLARILLYMILLVFVAVTIISNRHLITYSNLYYLVKDINAATVTAQSSTGYFNYPVSTVTPDVATYRGGLVIAGGGEVTVLSGAGKQTLSETTDHAHPCVRAADRYFVIFGRGETDFAVYNAFGRMYREDTAYPIYDACMGDNGSFAILTRSQDYTSEVILYNGDMGKIAGVHLNGYVTALCMNPTGDVTAILSMERTDAATETKLTILRTGDRVETEEVILEDTLVGSAGFLTDDRLAIVCRDRLIVKGTDGRTVTETSFEGREPQQVAFGRGALALLIRDASGLGETTLTLYDRNGRQTASADMPEVRNVTEMIWNNGNVYVRTSYRVWQVNDKGQVTASLEVDGQILGMLDAGKETPLLCTLAYAYCPSADDFLAAG